MTEEERGHELPDEDKEQRRRVIENVLVAFRPELREEFGEWIREVPDPATALQGLADISNIDRLLKHRLLIDSLRRTPAGGEEALDDPVRNVLGSTISGDDELRESRLRAAMQVLGDVVTAPGDARMREEHWAEWVRRTDPIFGFTVHEATFTACDDERIVRKRRNREGALVDCRLIVAQFWSNRPPTAFARYVDPENWPRCSAFWRAMRPLSDKTEQRFGYDCEFEETVVILGRPLTVPLEVAFRVRPDQGRVWTRFNIAPGHVSDTVPVDVDTGIVSAQSTPGGPAQTLVRATKYLHWKDRSADFSKLACDFGWSEFMVQMAEACLEPTVSVESVEAAAATGPSVDDAIKRLVEEVVTECQDGIRATGPHLERLIGRFTGRSWDARWINDLLAMGVVTVDRYGAIASSVRRFADSLRDAADREEGS